MHATDLADQKESIAPVALTRRIIGISSIISAAIQLISAPSFMMVQCLAICLLGIWLLNLQIRTRHLQTAPFSILMLIGFGSTYFYIPLVCTTMYFTTIDNNLSIPVPVLTASLAVYVFLILAQRACLTLKLPRMLRRKIHSNLLTPLGFFIKPSDTQLWFMGLVGVSSFIVVTTMGEAAVGPVIKFFQAFRFFSFAPFLLLVKPLYSQSNDKKVSAALVLIYIGVLFFLAMSSGSRAFAVIGLVTAALCFLLAWWSGVIEIRSSDLKYVSVMALGILALANPISRAFIAAKAGGGPGKSVRTFQEAFHDFVEAYNSDEIIEEYLSVREVLSSKSGTWSENYLDNEFLRRLANLKFLDNTLGLLFSMNESNRETLRKIEGRKIAATLPSPLFNLLGLEYDKKSVLANSMGDLFYSEGQSKDIGIGGFKTGSLIASAYNLFGLWFPLMIALAACPLFILLDALAFSADSEIGLALQVSPLGMVQAYYIFSMFGSGGSLESYSGLVAMVFRNCPQWFFLYLVLFWTTRVILSLTGIKSSAQHLSS